MKDVPTIAIVSWQRSEHGDISQRREYGNIIFMYETCSVSCLRLMTTTEHRHISLRSESWSVSCHRLMPTVKAWLFIIKVWNMLRQSSSSLDNGQSMVIYPLGMNHAHSWVIVTWQQSEHGNISLMYEACSVSCHRPMTTDWAWFYIPKVWIMLRQLSSSHDNGQIMVIYPSQAWFTP